MKRCHLNIPRIVYPACVKAAQLFLVALFLFACGKSQSNDIQESIYKLRAKGTPEEVVKHISTANLNFKNESGNRINFGIVGGDYRYIVLKLYSPHTYTGRYLCIDNTSLDTLSVFKMNSSGNARLVYQAGALVMFNTGSRYVWHTVPVEVKEGATYYVIALKAAQRNINVRFEILSADVLQRKYQSYERFVFFYIGVVCMIAMIILLAYLLFKRGVFAAYLGYVICVFAWILSHYGRLFPFLYPKVPVINEVIKPVTSLGASVFLILVLLSVFRKDLQARQWLRELLKQIMVIVMVFTACMFLLLIPALIPGIKTALMITWHVGLILSIGAIIFTPLFLLRSGSTARIFSAAMLMICIMSLVQIFANSGYINNYFICEHGVTMGSLLEMIIMAFGLVHNLLEEKKQQELQVITLENTQMETLKKLITVQDNERRRIAGDLHDNIGPLLAALKINFGRIVHTKEPALLNGIVAKTESIIDDSIAEIRNVAHNLMPKSLSSNGLINTLNDYLDNIQQLYNKTIVFNHQVQLILNPELQIHVYRIICELVLNAVKHSNAPSITIGIIADDEKIVITIKDDGRGFMVNTGNQKKSLGLQNVESRVLYMKGAFSLQTNPGEGTAINIQIPLQPYHSNVNGF